MLDRELCLSTSKLIGDEKDTQIFYSIQDHTPPHRPVLREVVGSRIVVPPTIPPSQ